MICKFHLLLTEVGSASTEASLLLLAFENMSEGATRRSRRQQVARIP
jgi:hypothetical protein